MANYTTQYQNLGQFSFTTGPDLTGLNPGNMTSTLDTTTIKASKFELYRLVVGVNNIPSATPMIVQTGTATVNAGTLLTATLSKNVSTGNMVVVAAATSTGTITACTIGTNADNFAAIPSTATVNASSGNFSAVSMWADPGLAATGSVINATLGASSYGASYVYEISGVVTSTAIGTVKDFSGSAGGNSSPASSPAGVTSASEDIAIGVAAAGFGAGGGSGATTNTTFSQPTTWTQQPVILPFGDDAMLMGISGYTLIPGTGSPGEYSINFTPSNSVNTTAQAIAAFLSEEGQTTALPFTVLVDNQTWDVSTTVPGVGFTYDPQNAMYLNVGQQLRVLWTSLPSSLYANYATNFVVTAFFRYDPALPGNLQGTYQTYQMPY